VVPGSIADFLQGSVLLGGLAGLGGFLWASIRAETTERRPMPRPGPAATGRRARPDEVVAGSPSPPHLPARSMAQSAAGNAHVRSSPDERAVARSAMRTPAKS